MGCWREAVIGGRSAERRWAASCDLNLRSQRTLRAADASSILLLNKKDAQSQSALFCDGNQVTKYVKERGWGQKERLQASGGSRSSFAASPQAAARRRSFPLALHCKLNTPDDSRECLSLQDGHVDARPGSTGGVPRLVQIKTLVVRPGTGAEGTAGRPL